MPKDALKSMVLMSLPVRSIEAPASAPHANFNTGFSACEQSAAITATKANMKRLIVLRL